MYGLSTMNPDGSAGRMHALSRILSVAGSVGGFGFSGHTYVKQVGVEV